MSKENRKLFAGAALAAAVLGVGGMANQAQAVLVLYEPFDYPANRFLANTPVGTAPGTSQPIGYLAPNSNNWYGTGIATNYAVADDGQVTSADLTVAGLDKPNATRSLTMGGTGHTFRLSLNNSTPGSPNQAAGSTNSLDTVNGGKGYYSVAVRVGDITGLNATGGALLGFNTLINAQTTNPATVAAALTIRPKAGGGPGEFELGILKQQASNFANATWDTVNTYTTNTTIFVVGKYESIGTFYPGGSPAPTDDVASLWINPASATFGGADPASPLTNTGPTSGNDMPSNASTNFHPLQSFMLRQNGTATNNQIPVDITYDELRVGTTYADVTPPIPEPAGLAMLALAGAGLLARRRVRREP